MDIDLLSKIIKELIHDCDKITLPGLGAFIAEVVPATFSDRGYTINPPYKRLIFRQGLEEDSLIVDLYAESNNVSQNDAERILREFLMELKNILFQKKTIIFPGLGRLRATKENNIFFIADEDLDIYPLGFAMEPISLKTNKATSEDVKESVEELASILNTPVTQDCDAPQDSEAVLEGEVAKESEGERNQEQGATDINEEEAVEVENEEAENKNVEVEKSEEPEQTQECDRNSQECEQGLGEQKKAGAVWKWLLIIIGIAAAAIIVFAVVARIAPELVDKLLYSPEELEILYKSIE